MPRLARATVGWAKRSVPTILLCETVMVGTAQSAPLPTLQAGASQPPGQGRNKTVGIGLVIVDVG